MASSLYGTVGLWVATTLTLYLMDWIVENLMNGEKESDYVRPMDVMFSRTTNETLSYIDDCYNNTKLARPGFWYHVLVDSFFPPLYGHCIHASFVYLMRRWEEPSLRLERLFGWVLAAGCFADVIENFCFLYLLSIYPEQNERVAAISCPATKIKFVGLGVGLTSIMVLLLWRACWLLLHLVGGSWRGKEDVVSKKSE